MIVKVWPPNGKAEPQRRVGGITTLNKYTNKSKNTRSAGKRTKALLVPAGVGRLSIWRISVRTSDLCQSRYILES
jgi:hypothetical protein